MERKARRLIFTRLLLGIQLMFAFSNTKDGRINNFILKIIYPICCGIDVHKKFIVACIASTNSVGVTTYQSKRFSTFTNGLHELSKWLSKNSCIDFTISY